MPDLVVSRPHRHADTARCLETIKHGVQQLIAGEGLFRRQRKGGGHGDATGMNHRCPMDIVDFENVSEPAHEESPAACIAEAALRPLHQTSARLAVASRNRVGHRIEREQRRLFKVCPVDRSLPDQPDEPLCQGLVSTHGKALGRLVVGKTVTDIEAEQIDGITPQHPMLLLLA